MFFSHTTKGQQQNMPMLKMLKERQCTLIDYEKITDKKGRRLVFFGTQAGQAGMIEVLSALGKKIAIKGFQKNPFVSVMQPYQYKSLAVAKKEILRVSRYIKKNGLEDALTPLIAGFAGYGHTSQGAQEIFDLLPCEEIKPGELDEFIQRRKYSSHKVYKIVFKEEHMVETREKNSVFDLQDYYNYPEKYRSKFELYLPYLTLLMNCIYWESKYPRFVPNKALKKMFENTKHPKLQVIGDISCDFKGSIECNRYATTPDNPVFTYDPIQDEIKEGFFGNGVAVMSIDNLPAEIPLESSVNFSRVLELFMPKIAKADFSKDFGKCKLPSEIKKAVILFRGEFTPDYKYMEKFIT
jgi:alpha-aminoadipic semialdehyde synthase